MGTKVHHKSFLPGFYSMRDLNEDSSSSSWPFFYGDKTVANGQYCNGFMPRTLTNGYPGHDKDTLKQKMIEHEEVFKNQVSELHRLYQIQRHMMEEAKRKELNEHQTSKEPSSSSSLQGSQMPSEDARKRHACMPTYPLLNSNYSRTSLMGVEIVNSPMSCTKRLPQFPFENGSTSKDSEAMDIRPLKVRKKFDLQLPADEYIDIEGGENTDTRKDASASTTGLRGSIGLADLNEPIQIEESKDTSSFHFLGHTLNNGGLNTPAKPNAGYFGVTGESMIVSERKFTEREQFYHKYEAGSSRSTLSSIPQARQPNKLPIPSHPVPGLLNQVCQPPGIHLTGYSSQGQWKNGFQCCLESSRSHDHCNNSYFEPIASQTPGSNSFLSSSSFGSPWAHPVPSWSTPTKNSFANGSLQPCDQSREPSGEKLQVGASSSFNHGMRSELMTPSQLYHPPSRPKNLQVHLPSASFDYRNCNRGDIVASGRSTTCGIGNFSKAPCPVGSKPAMGINLNEVIFREDNMIDGKGKPENHLPALPSWLNPKPVRCKEVVSARSFFCENERVDLNQLFSPQGTSASNDCKIVAENETAETQNVKKILGFPIGEVAGPKIESPSLASTSASVHCHKNVDSERTNNIIDINVACELDEPIADDESILENDREKTSACIRDFIDLNTSASDSEDPPAPPVPCYGSKSSRVKIEIDLEVPAFPESEDDQILPSEDMPHEVSLQPLLNNNEEARDEVLRDAAETIISISTTHSQIPADHRIGHPSGVSLADPLLWFVDTVMQNEIESTLTAIGGSGSLEHGVSEVTDEFEAMTLQLQEMKEEDYLPKPFVPENVEDMGADTLPTRSRRGQSRRGRMRRDFQRDILPGLVSLSRHEVSEDLQVFGGLMKATGHSWNVGLTRRNGTRNGGGRGRRRTVVETVPADVPSTTCSSLVQQLNKVDSGLEEKSLTGWGKTTRRPRRQRCPAGNPSTVAST